MERVEIIAKEGFKLTQVAEAPIEERMYVSRVYTTTPNDWKEVPLSEYEEWEATIKQLQLQSQVSTINEI